MSALSAEVSQGHLREVVTSNDLEEVLQDAAREAQTKGMLGIIFLYAPNKDQLSLVVGGNETVLGFNYGHGDPPYYASVGETDEVEPVLTAFVGFDHHTEFPRRWVVSMARGRTAAFEFLETGLRPISIEWEQV